jgi:hypothetical protein
MWWTYDTQYICSLLVDWLFAAQNTLHDEHERRLHDATDLTLPIPNGRHDLHDVVHEISVHDHSVFKLLPNFTFLPHPNNPVLNILNGHSERLLDDDIEGASVPSLCRDHDCQNSILSPPISVSSTFPIQWIE